MQYWYSNNGKQEGPFTLKQIKSLNLSENTLIFKTGENEWKKRVYFPEFLNPIPSSQRKIGLDSNPKISTEIISTRSNNRDSDEIKMSNVKSNSSNLFGCFSMVLKGMFITLIVLFITNPDESKLRSKLSSEGILNIHNVACDDFGIISFYGVKSVGINGVKERYYIGIGTKFILFSEE